ncbi:hypothetical protein ATE92_0603 [Ulvibacter sp. MAR_2010_11]|uniref:hypothetical protein n=1 Tax=Ulvibacter sp. MAR_2010_11 TaxID=1250229 RepID=UPI000C2BB3AC|nr:hypothetical protein [Ulvibacter sp. MAR_2010_11]PKA82473.1 hypothetical protein ATE92_0603 [Ulvibacter sp. MAR_2010_11]
MEHPIFQKIENAKKPDFGDILSKSFELFKKVWEQALYHVLITLAAVVPMILLVYIPYIAFFLSMGALDTQGNYDYVEPDLMEYLPLLIGYIIVVLALIFVVQAFVYGITAHFIRVLKKEDLGTNEDVGGYLSLLKGNYKKLMLLSLATFGIALLATLACYLPIFYVMVPLQLLVVFFAFHPELTVSEIIKASFKLGNKYWLIIFGLVIVSSLIAQLGIILCIVGVFFTAYFVHIPMYYIYKDCIGFDTVSEENESLIVS